MATQTKMSEPHVHQNLNLSRDTVTQVSPSLKKVGFWSAVLATVFSFIYVVGQLAEWLRWLGSNGGPESASTPLGLVVLLTPSLFLGSAFLFS